MTTKIVIWVLFTLIYTNVQAYKNPIVKANQSIETNVLIKKQKEHRLIGDVLSGEFENCR